MTRFEQDGYAWEACADFRDSLAAVFHSPGQSIKESAAKLVTAHDVAGRQFYIKRYRHDVSPWRPWKFLFKASQARQEWRNAAELEKRRLPVVRHVALGEKWSWRGLRESVLITAGFDGVPLDAAGSIDLARVVRFVEQIAAAGAVHHDLHPANLLVQPASGEIRLVDLHGMEIGGSRAANRDEMLAFLRVFLPLPVSQDIVERSRAVRKRALAHRARRCLKTNRDFARRSFGGLSWHVRLDALSPAVQRALNDPDRFLASARPLKQGRSSTVGAADGIVIKRFNFRRWLRPVKDLFRATRARAAFRKAYHLELAGLPTARVIAAADERMAGLAVRGYVVMQEIRGAIDAGQWQGNERQACQSVARLVARLHDEGFSHRDLKETNILFDGAGAVCLIDLEGVRFEFDVPSEMAAANLRRLAESAAMVGKLTRGNVVRFLHEYCRARRIRPRELFHTT